MREGENEFLRDTIKEQGFVAMKLSLFDLQLYMHMR